ncbi:hypothetical protein HII36_44270 [Nonomuraea sp. NN258]|uniref:hypothetical protein n=1 Tax=Nonomuraea antri TaxID=2730852 RepID=UPI00156A3A6E|nr:hypothetical protein [Nonomuraea antri]NRQ38793.1 hypothetical protein [Nonomuraea antri]
MSGMSRRQVVARLVQHAAFQYGALSAVCYAPQETGRMPGEWAERYRADADRTVYMVRSYATPIAWVRDDGHVVIPDHNYSATTTRHQRLCRAWL